MMCVVFGILGITLIGLIIYMIWFRKDKDSQSEA